MFVRRLPPVPLALPRHVHPSNLLGRTPSHLGIQVINRPRGMRGAIVSGAPLTAGQPARPLGTPFQCSKAILFTWSLREASTIPKRGSAHPGGPTRHDPRQKFIWGNFVNLSLRFPMSQRLGATAKNIEKRRCRGNLHPSLTFFRV